MQQDLVLAGKLALIHPDELRRPILVRLGLHRSDLYGVLQANGGERIPINSTHDILCVFPGKYPRFGKAYDILVESYEKTIKLDGWGSIDLFRTLAETELKNLLRGLRRVVKYMRQHGLDYILPIRSEIRQAKGKQVGKYVSVRGDADNYIVLLPKGFADLKLIEHAATHELAHPLWQQYMNESLHAEWITLYHSFNKIKELRANDLQEQLDNFKTAHTTFRLYRKELDSDATMVFDAILDWIKHSHNMPIKFLDMLYVATQNIDEYWPTSKLHLSEIVIPVTQYSAKNPEEFWAESFSLYCIGSRDQLPRKVRRMVERSIRKLQPK